MHAVDRCWCDFSAGGFFQPFNVSHWEYASVKRLSLELERQTDNSTLKKVGGSNGAQEADLVINTTQTLPPSPEPIQHGQKKFWWLRSPFASKQSPTGEVLPTPGTNSHEQESMQPSSLPSPEAPPLLRKDYDLRPYGFGVTVDFAWS